MTHRDPTLPVFSATEAYMATKQVNQKTEDDFLASVPTLVTEIMKVINARIKARIDEGAFNTTYPNSNFRRPEITDPVLKILTTFGYKARLTYDSYDGYCLEIDWWLGNPPTLWETVRAFFAMLFED